MNEKKAKVLELLLQGNSIVAVAESVGCARQTIYNWMNTDEDFKQAKEQAEGKIVDDLYLVAMGELENLLYNGSSYERVNCATQILKYKKANDVNVKIEKPQSVEELLAQL